MKFSWKFCVSVFSCIVLLIGISITYVQSTVWWAGFNLQNCPTCQPVIDWSEEFDRQTVTESHTKSFQDDGVLVLQSAISPKKIVDLTNEVNSMSDTFMTSVLAKVLLPQYAKYEHRLDTRSELIRDWAVHGPLATWAAKLMNVSEVRLYNAEKIFSAGKACETAWHRDTVGAPFPLNTKSIAINVYLDDIGADGPNGDVLIFVKGTHRNLQNPPSVHGPGLFEPTLKVGDILAHDPRIYHTPSGRGCWNRRSLQFRYVASPTVFTFGPNRFPHGLAPWSLAHAAGIAPHGLSEGLALEGPWYPLVYPKPLAAEHKPLEGEPWSVSGVLSATSQAQDLLTQLGIGEKDNCTIQRENREEFSYFGLDGPVMNCMDWAIVNGLPFHKEGQMIKTMQ